MTQEFSRVSVIYHDIIVLLSVSRKACSKLSWMAMYGHLIISVAKYCCKDSLTSDRLQEIMHHVDDVRDRWLLLMYRHRRGHLREHLKLYVWLERHQDKLSCMWPSFIIKLILYLLFTKHTVHVIQYKAHYLTFARGYASGLLHDAASICLRFCWPCNIRTCMHTIQNVSRYVRDQKYGNRSKTEYKS